MNALMVQRPPQPDDAVGRYFAARRRLGVLHRFGIGSLHEDGELRWNCYDHVEVDGLGAMLQLMESEGHEYPVTECHRPAPAGWQQAIAAWRYVRRMRHGTRAWPERVEGSGARDEAAWFALPVEADAKMVEAARAAGSSLNCWILWTLQRALWEGGFLPERSFWGVPVNLRGSVRLKDSHSNHVGDVPLWVDAMEGPSQLHAALREGLREGLPWGPWWLLQQVSWLGDAGFDFLAARGGQGGDVMTGVVSNGGRWTGRGDVSSRMICPPAGSDVPVSVGVACWNGSWSGSLRVHGDLVAAGVTAVGLRDAWVRLLCELLDTEPRFLGTFDPHQVVGT